jgi:hypothetical protein
MRTVADPADSRVVNCSSENGPLLSVVTPVFNGAGFIVENVDIIRSEFAGGIPAARIHDTGARTVTALARDASAPREEPSLTGTRPDGSPWAAADEKWSRQSIGDGWVRYKTTIGDADGPLAGSITDPRSSVDITATTNTPGSMVRIFGTKRLLP